MKNIYGLLLICFAACTGGDADYKNRLFQSRANKNYDFMQAGETPLDSFSLATFKGLHYYEPDINYRVEATFTAIPISEVFGFPHTLNRTYNYREAGILRFTINGQALELTGYEREGSVGDSLELFIPFTDKTNGKETYGGGRYIDVKVKPTQQEVILDFNTAYNPYCAYNEAYSCPIPPAQNRLAVAIEAGEKLLFPAH